MNDIDGYDINEIRAKLRAYFEQKIIMVETPLDDYISREQMARALLHVLDFLHYRYGLSPDWNPHVPLLTDAITDEDMQGQLDRLGNYEQVQGIAVEQLEKGRFLICDGNKWRWSRPISDDHYDGIALIDAAPGQPIIVAKRKE